MQTQVAPGTQVDWNGTHYEALLTPHETGGKFGVFLSDAGPGKGPPRHRHPKADEVFIILQGRIRFWRVWGVSERTAGEVFHIPAGIEHAFVVVERARWIGILSPGGLESFFPTVAAQGLEIPRDLAEIKAIATQSIWRLPGHP